MSGTVGPIQGAPAMPCALEGEEPAVVGEADGAQGCGDTHGGLLALDRVGVGCGDGAVVLDAVFGDGGAGGCGGAGRGADGAGHDGAAGDGMGGEEDGDAGASDGAGLGPGWPHAFGEGEGEQGLVGPAGDELDGELVAYGLHEGAAVEAGAGAGVLRGEAEDAGMSDAVGDHLGDGVGDVRGASCACRRRRAGPVRRR